MSSSAPVPEKTKVFSRDFTLLFCLTIANNSYLAVFYCFEQWLDGLRISPNWRGLLLAALFAMITLWRPLASIVLLPRDKLPALVASIFFSSAPCWSIPSSTGPTASG